MGRADRWKGQVAEVQILKATETQCDLLVHELRAALALNVWATHQQEAASPVIDRSHCVLCASSRAREMSSVSCTDGIHNHTYNTSRHSRLAERARKRKLESVGAPRTLCLLSHTRHPPRLSTTHTGLVAPLSRTPHLPEPRQTPPIATSRHLPHRILLLLGLARVDSSARESLVRTPNFVRVST